MTHDATNPVHLADVAGVRSRISWGALLGGAVIAIATAMVITFFFTAMGLSLTDVELRSDGLGIGALVAAVATIVVALFLGGWVTTQLTAGETRQEAVIYGVLTWAVVTAFSLGMVGMGVRAGYFALVGGTMVAQNSPAVQQRGWDEMAREAGASQASIDSAKQSVNPERVKAEMNDPANREKARKAAVTASWAALVATLLSIGAAVAGAVVGVGPEFRLFPVGVARRPDLAGAR